MNDRAVPGWLVVPLEELIVPGGLFDGPFGSSLKTEDYTDQGVRVIRLENLANLRFIAEKETYISYEKYEDLLRHTVHEGDVLFGSFVDGPTRVCLMPRLSTPAIAKADCFTIRPQTRVVDPAFLVYQFGTGEARDKLVEQIHGATRPRINTKQLRAFGVQVPPINEQKRIVAKIEELTTRSRRAKEALDAVPALLDKLRQSILAAAFRGDLTADWRAKNPNVEPADQLLARIRPGHLTTESAGEGPRTLSSGLPSNWVWATLGEICVIASGQTPKGIESVLRSDGAVPWFRVGDMNLDANQMDMVEMSNGLSASDAKKLGVHVRPAGTIIFPKRGGAILTNKKRRLRTPGAYDLNIMGLVPAEGIGEYLFRWFGTVDLARLNNGSTIPQINNGDVLPLRVPLPPAKEQLEIIRVVDRCIGALSVAASVVDTQMESLSRLGQSILAKAFRGELVPQDPTDEPASALLDRIRATREATAQPKPRRARKASAEAPAIPPKQPRQQKPTPEPAQLTLELTPSALAAEVFPALWPRGPLDKDTAVRILAEHLRAKGAVEFTRLRADGPLYTQLLAAIEAAAKSGELDRPRRGHVRAIKLDANVYTPDDWRQVLLASLGHEPTHQEDAVRQAAEWARDNLGLEFTRLRADGHIATGLRSAITSAIRQGLVERDGPRRIRLAGG